MNCDLNWVASSFLGHIKFEKVCLTSSKNPDFYIFKIFFLSYIYGRSTPALKLPYSDLPAPYQKVCVRMYNNNN